MSCYILAFGMMRCADGQYPRRRIPAGLPLSVWTLIEDFEEVEGGLLV